MEPSPHSRHHGGTASPARPARPKPTLSLPEFPLSQAQRYYLTIANLAQARGPDPDLAFQGSSPQSFASALQEALRQPMLFHRWKAKQPDPDEVDQSLAPVDPTATVSRSEERRVGKECRCR